MVSVRVRKCNKCIDYSNVRILWLTSWPNICLALCRVMLPVIVCSLKSIFFQRQLDGSKFKEEPLTSLDKISENFVRRADGKLQSSNKKK